VLFRTHQYPLCRFVVYAEKSCAAVPLGPVVCRPTEIADDRAVRTLLRLRISSKKSTYQQGKSVVQR
jgi:hypothetical protein